MVENGDNTITCCCLPQEEVAPNRGHNYDLDSNEITVAINVGDDALENSYAGAVEQRPPRGEGLARRSEASLVQETAVELRDEKVVELVIRCSAVKQDMDEVAAVTGAVVDNGRW